MWPQARVVVVNATVVGAAALAAPHTLFAQPAGQSPPLSRFVEATRDDNRVASAALRDIGAAWKDGYASRVTDLARMMRPPR